VKGWVIPPRENSSFVAYMEQVLDVYKRPFSSSNPVICMDESPKQLIKETRLPIAMKKGCEAKIDYEYERCGVCNIFMFCEPLCGKRFVIVSEKRTKKEWANHIKEISDEYYKEAERITLVMDNLNTHKPASLYEVFPPAEAKKIWDRFEFIYTPKHGSWLNIAEIELNVLHRQCLNRHIDNIEKIKREVIAWQKHRNNKNSKVDWQFTTNDARIKLKHLYPSIDD